VYRILNPDFQYAIQRKSGLSLTAIGLRIADPDALADARPRSVVQSLGRGDVTLASIRSAAPAYAYANADRSLKIAIERNAGAAFSVGTSDTVASGSSGCRPWRLAESFSSGGATLKLPRPRQALATGK
jgi:hypothetical protein